MIEHKYAFPVPIDSARDGMTLRAWLAGQALAGILAHEGRAPIRHAEAYKATLSGAATAAAGYADALLAELEKPKDAASARLIAAAPALLEACQEVLAWATREAMPQGGKNDGPWEQVEDAIASAEAQ